MQLGAHVSRPVACRAGGWGGVTAHVEWCATDDSRGQVATYGIRLVKPEV